VSEKEERKKFIKEMAEDQTARILGLDDLQDKWIQGVALSGYLKHLYEEYDIQPSDLWQNDEFEKNVNALVKKNIKDTQEDED